MSSEAAMKKGKRVLDEQRLTALKQRDDKDLFLQKFDKRMELETKPCASTKQKL